MIKKKILKIVLIMITLILLMQVHSMAAVIVSTDKQVETDSGTVTISVTSKQSLGAYTLQLTDTAGLTLVSASAGENAQISDDNKTITASYANGTTSLGSFTFKVPSVTKDTKYSIKFSITGMETPDLKGLDSKTNTAVLTVKAKQTTPEDKDNTTGKTTTPEAKPTFSNVNEKVYATGEINVRASYSTSSKIVGTTKKGEEITRTGIGSNGWSKVTYKGTTAYIRSDLLTTTKPKEEEKSSNANLKSLVVEGQEFTPKFSTNTTSYKMQVTKEVTDLTIKAEAEDAKATISIQGEKGLKEGDNIVTVSVSAEDGTVKIYEILATKLAETTLGLQSLKIEGTDIEDDFKTEVYNYRVQIEDVAELSIEAVANDETATVEIMGNENLQEGENIITIMVSSQDGKEKVTYQIKANKIVRKVEEPTNTMDPKIYLYIGVGAVLLVALIIVIVYTIKHRNQEEYEYTDNYEDFPEELPERQVKEDLENTQEINTLQEEPLDEKERERKAKLDYFLDTKDDEQNDGRGKHF